MSGSVEVETPLGTFVVTATTPRAGTIYSKGQVVIDNRAFIVRTRWNLRPAAAPGGDDALVVSALGLDAQGTWAQGVRGNWYASAVRQLRDTLRPHVLRLVEEPELPT